MAIVIELPVSRIWHDEKMTSARGAAFAVAFLMMGLAKGAHADPQACAAAAEDGQKLRAAGKLLAARSKLTECAVAACPALIRDDCARWNADLAATMPSIIIDARDADLRDLADVEVSIDGTTRAPSLDGKSIAIDPGPHRLVFHHAGSPPIIENVIIKEGARGRLFSIRFGATLRPAQQQPVAAPSKPEEPVVMREHTPWPWVVVGVGGAVTVLGVLAIVTAPGLPTGCHATSRSCTPLQGETDREHATRQDDAGTSQSQPRLGLIVGLTGLAIAGGGLLWHFLEPSGPTRSATLLAPWASASGSGLATSGTF